MGLMQHRVDFPESGDIKPYTERKESFGKEWKKNSTHRPKLGSKGMFIREGVNTPPTEHVSSQRQKVFREFSVYVIP